MDTQANPEFGPPLIGQTEKALNAILLSRLEGTEVSEMGWVLLRLAGAADGRLGRQELVERAGSVSKFAAEDAEAEIGTLVWAELPAREDDKRVTRAAAV